MSKRRLRYSRDPLEILERVLNKTTLTTQKLRHFQIQEQGDKALGNIHKTHEIEKEQLVKDAVAEVESRATRELTAAIKRLKAKLEDERKRALERQHEHYECLAKRVAEQRDRLENERMRLLTKKLQKEKQEALQEQWQEAQRLKEIAIEDACNALRIQLRKEFIIEKEQAVAQALAIAREKFRLRELETIKRVKEECEKVAAEEAARVAEINRHEMDKQLQRYSILHQRYKKEIAHKQRVEKDFMELQEDYRRFMDYTDGKFHSDFMMMIRSYGMKLANKRLSVVTYDDIESSDKETSHQISPVRKPGNITLDLPVRLSLEDTLKSA